MIFNGELEKQDANNGGLRYTKTFKNRYGISVILNKDSIGYRDGFYEIALLYDDEITYKKPLADGVLGYLTEEDVMRYIEKIKKL